MDDPEKVQKKIRLLISRATKERADPREEADPREAKQNFVLFR